MITMEGLANDLNEILQRILNDHCFCGLRETTLQNDVMVRSLSVQQIEVFNELE